MKQLKVEFYNQQYFCPFLAFISPNRWRRREERTKHCLALHGNSSFIFLGENCNKFLCFLCFHFIFILRTSTTKFSLVFSCHKFEILWSMLQSIIQQIFEILWSMSQSIILKSLEILCCCTSLKVLHYLVLKFVTTKMFLICWLPPLRGRTLIKTIFMLGENNK